jgi:O-antigen ligase
MWNEINDNRLFMVLMMGVMALFISNPYIIPLIDIPIRRVEDFLKIPYMISILTVLLLVLFSFVTVFFARLSPYERDRILVTYFFATPFIVALSKTAFHPTLTCIILMFLVIYCRSAFSGRIDLVWSPMYLLIPLLPISIMLSSLGPFARNWFGTIESNVAAYYLPCVIVINLVRTRVHLEMCLKTLFVLSVLSSIVGVSQFIIYETTGILTTFTEPLFQFRATPIGVLPRVTGFESYPDIYGAVSAIMGVMMFYFHPEHLTAKERKFCLYGFILNLMAATLTISRGTWLGMALVFMIIPIMKRPQYLIHYLAVVLIIVVIGFVSGGFEAGYRIMDEMGREGASLRFRGALNAIAYDGIKRFPIFGVGINGFIYYNNAFNNVVHNFWLRVLVEMGLVGLVFHLAFLLVLTLRLVDRMIQSHGRERMVLEAFFLGMTIFWFLTNFQPTYSSKFYWFYFGLVEASVLILGRRDGDQKFLPFFA